MLRIRSAVAVVAAVAAFATATAVRAQCTPNWLLPDGLGVDGDIHCALAWDPDGAGPIGPRLVLGGTFTRCGGVAANRLAVVDLATRTVVALGSGANATVRSLAVGPSNELYVGGAFTAIDGVSATAFADEAGISANNAGVRLHRAHRALKARVREVCTTCADHGCSPCSCLPSPTTADAAPAAQVQPHCKTPASSSS